MAYNIWLRKKLPELSGTYFSHVLPAHSAKGPWNNTCLLKTYSCIHICPIKCNIMWPCNPKTSFQTARNWLEWSGVENPGKVTIQFIVSCWFQDTQTCPRPNANKGISNPDRPKQAWRGWPVDFMYDARFHYKNAGNKNCFRHIPKPIKLISPHLFLDLLNHEVMAVRKLMGLGPWKFPPEPCFFSLLMKLGY